MSNRYDSYLNTEYNSELNTNYFEGGYSNNLIGGKKIVGINYRDGHLKLCNKFGPGEGEGYIYDDSDDIDKRINELEAKIKSFEGLLNDILTTGTSTPSSTPSTHGSEKVEELKKQINKYVEDVKNTGKIKIEEKEEQKENANQLGKALAAIIQMFLKNQPLPEIV